MSKIVKATNIKELYKSLTPGKWLDRDDDEFYVPLYEEQIDSIRFDLENSELSSHTIYISGQSGTGKTTALNFLANKDLEALYEFKYLYAQDLFDLSDIDIIDILLMISYDLVKGNKILESEFLKDLEKIKNTAEGKLEAVEESSNEAIAEGGGGLNLDIGNSPISKFFAFFKISGDLFAKFKMDKSYREMTRRVFAFSKKELFDLTNDVIDRYEEKVLDGKKLLLVFNELDHIKNPKFIRNLFISNRNFFEGLRCRKVVSIPVVLILEAEFRDPDYFFGLKVNTNPLRESKRKDEELVLKNKTRLGEIVKNRIADNADLFDEDALEFAINHSGGVVRQMIQILFHASRKVGRLGGNKISLNDVEDGAAEFTPTITRSIISAGKIELLNEVREHCTPKAEDKNILIESLLGNQILIYRNRPDWYMLNPLADETVKVYAEKTHS
ncbi:MAG: hypothetical protein GYB31_21165 [Bacteroidetes bacterium]|nr:hypothetical protein [Bacteroidota bacterium]